jgi:hypothetical protein
MLEDLSTEWGGSDTKAPWGIEFFRRNYVKRLLRELTTHSSTRLWHSSEIRRAPECRTPEPTIPSNNEVFAAVGMRSNGGPAPSSTLGFRLRHRGRRLADLF